MVRPPSRNDKTTTVKRSHHHKVLGGPLKTNRGGQVLKKESPHGGAFTGRTLGGKAMPKKTVNYFHWGRHKIRLHEGKKFTGGGNWLNKIKDGSRTNGKRD